MQRYVSVLVILVCVGVLASMGQAATWPNEPSGSTLITQDPWVAGSFPCNYCADAYGWRDVYNQATIVQNPNGKIAPGSAPYVLQLNYTTSTCVDCAPDTIDYSFAGQPTKQLYSAFWFMLSNNFDNASGTKLWFNWQGDGGSFKGAQIPSLTKVAGRVHQTFQMYIPNLPGTSLMNCQLANVEGATCPGGPGPVLAHGDVQPYYEITPGVWHRLEGYYKVGTSETSQDSIIRVWIDGTLVMNYTNANLVAYPFFDVQISPTYHGLPPDNSFYIWYDDVRISRPSSAPAPDAVPPSPPLNLVAR